MDTKADILQGAYSQMRISGLTVQPTPEDASLGIIRLEDMMDEFFGRGLCVGFNFEEVPNLTTPHGMARKYRQMAQTNLAIRLVPDFNKVVPQTLTAQAKQSYSFAIGAATLENLREVQAPRRMPRGSGNTLRYNRWQRFNRPTSLPDNDCATNNLIAGDVNDYSEDFSSYLEGETISSFTITATKALRIIDKILVSQDVNFDTVCGAGVWTCASTTIASNRATFDSATSSIEQTVLMDGGYDYEITLTNTPIGGAFVDVDVNGTQVGATITTAGVFTVTTQSATTNPAIVKVEAALNNTGYIELFSVNKIMSVSLNDSIKYRIEALDPATSGAGQSVVFTITTNTGRIFTRSKGFIVESKRA